MTERKTGLSAHYALCFTPRALLRGTGELPENDAERWRNEAMFDIDEVIMYGHYGLCRVINRQTMKFGDADPTLYYVLHPINDKKTTFYAPVNSDKISMRKLLSAEEIHALIHEMPEETYDWVKNDQQRREAFGQVMKSGDHRELVKIIKALYQKKEEKNLVGKKLQAFDEKTMKEAEKLLYEEFAFVLKIPQDDVVPYIVEQLQPTV